jgi:hypothetical protein
VTGWGEALRIDITYFLLSFAIPYEVHAVSVVAYRLLAPTHEAKNACELAQRFPEIPPTWKTIVNRRLDSLDNGGIKPPASAKSLPMKQMAFRNIVSKKSGVIL